MSQNSGQDDELRNIQESLEQEAAARQDRIARRKNGETLPDRSTTGDPGDGGKNAIIRRGPKITHRVTDQGPGDSPRRTYR